MADTLALRSQLDDLKNEYLECKRVDTNKYTLIEELFAQIDQLCSKLNDKESELQKERDLEGLYCERANEYGRKLRDLEQGIVRNVFVSVLVDGDGMPFRDDLIKRASSGGREAAHLLKRAVEEYVKSTLPRVDPNAKFLIRVYANVKGMSKAYKDANIVPEQYSFEEFVQEFNMADPLCDYVDAGTGKECSDEKIKENFKVHITDLHCQHVIFGGSADNGYARLLGPYSTNDEQSKRITMLQGPPFARELIDLVAKFATTSFESVFRKTKLNSRRVSFNVTPPASPSPNYASAVAQSLSQRPNQITSSASNSNIEAHAKTILRNSRGQRVDSPLQCSPNDVNDLKARKLCNSYHLLGQCPYRNCIHPHGSKLSGKQLEALRYIARLTPCTNGLGCNDASCIVGHQCPRKPCTLPSCRFPPEMHTVDTKVV